MYSYFSTDLSKRQFNLLCSPISVCTLFCCAIIRFWNLGDIVLMLMFEYELSSHLRACDILPPSPFLRRAMIFYFSTYVGRATSKREKRISSAVENRRMGPCSLWLKRCMRPCTMQTSALTLTTRKSPQHLSSTALTSAALTPHLGICDTPSYALQSRKEGVKGTVN